MPEDRTRATKRESRRTKRRRAPAEGQEGSRRSVLPCNLLTAGPRLSISWHNSGMGPSDPENVTYYGAPRLHRKISRRERIQRLRIDSSKSAPSITFYFIRKFDDSRYALSFEEEISRNGSFLRGKTRGTLFGRWHFRGNSQRPWPIARDK